MTMASNHCGSFIPIQQDDECHFQMFSSEGGTIMPQYMKDVANMMHIDSHSRQAEKQYFIINGSDHFSYAELQRTLFYGGSSGMDDGLFGTACPQPHLIGRPFQH
jgi:hypothetical protein